MSMEDKEASSSKMEVDKEEDSKISMLSKESIVKIIQSVFAENSAEPEVIDRLYECSLAMTEDVLDLAAEAARQRKSDSIEKCDIDLAITLFKQG